MVEGQDGRMRFGMYNRCQMKPVAQRERNVALSFKSLECAGNIEVQLKMLCGWLHF